MKIKRFLKEENVLILELSSTWFFCKLAIDHNGLV